MSTVCRQLNPDEEGARDVSFPVCIAMVVAKPAFDDRVRLARLRGQ